MKRVKSTITGKALSKSDLAYAIHYNSDWDYYKSLPFYLYSDIYSYEDMVCAFVDSHVIA